VDADGAADPPRARALHRSARRGYSRFEVVSQGIALELLQYVPLSDSIKISRLTIRNVSDRPRRLSVTAFAEWVLGLSRGASAPTVVTERDAATGAIFARNPWNMHHGGRVAFADLGGRQTAWTADRSEFIGRNCTIDNPAALSAAMPLSQRAGAGLDPCAALQTTVELERDGTTEVVFFLGQAGDVAEARVLIERYRGADLDAVHREVAGYWHETLGTVQVKTPDLAMDFLLNGPLLYQTLACRYWARSAFYQASGAYGFRDQLQDSCRSPWQGPSWPASTSCARRRGNSSRATSSIGGSRPPARRAHAHLRRPGMAGHGRGALRRDDRRCRHPRRKGAVPRRPYPQAGRARSVLPAQPRR
jgi:cellobiose phosphorylase